jgi:uncharacterized protein YyaL (SSP411 family)
VDRAAIEPVLNVILAAAPGAALSPAAVLCLLREYVAGGRGEVREAAERGLAQAVDAIAETRDARVRVQWLRTLAEASACTADEELASHIARELPSAIDLLETLVRRSYEPGEGLVGAPAGDQLRCASALLAAFDLTGRLPYAMLAEELLAAAQRHHWDAARSRFDADTAANCVAASVACRLAALHADPDYRARAVVAPQSAYRDDARGLLAAIGSEWRASVEEAAEYGVALQEWFALEAVLQ